jgi:small subunit ribosomal protein S9
MEVINSVGRRKEAIARVYLQEGKGNIIINDRDIKEYFPLAQLQYIAKQALIVTETEGKFDIKVLINGGGIKGQAEATRLAISRALIELDPQVKPVLKPHGFLTRDPREVERKKPGQKKARKKFQFSKR